MGVGISLKRAQQHLSYSIEDIYHVQGMVPFFGRLPHSLPFPYEGNKIFFKSLDGTLFARFSIHATKPRILVCDLSTGATIDLYFYNPSFEYAVHKASGRGARRLMPNGKYTGWGQHVIKNWELIQQEFQPRNIKFTEENLRMILQATLNRRTY